MEKGDEELILAFQAGDRTALTIIFQRYKTRILNFCTQLLGNRADAEEILGEVFLALFTNAFDIDKGAKFSTWFYTIARYKCIDCLRDRKKRGVFHGQEWAGADLPDHQDIPSGEMIRKEIGEQVRLAIHRLPPEEREAIVLRQYHKFSYQEISRILDCSLEKVKILIFRAKEHLRVQLAVYMREGGS